MCLATLLNSCNFYPRPPRGGRHSALSALPSIFVFLSTPSARRATAHSCPVFGRKTFLSTPSARRATSTFSIFWIIVSKFLSTPSARRATVFPEQTAGNEEISIHALREEGDTVSRAVSCISFISIHALREEGDVDYETYLNIQKEFLSTPSARRATYEYYWASVFASISIHALREEGDLDAWHYADYYTDFYPRPPRGGRHDDFHTAE